MKAVARNEDPAEYKVGPAIAPENQPDDWIINQALAILASRLERTGEVIDSPATLRNYLTIQVAALEYEVFGCVFLDARNKIIAMDEMFRGTLTQTSVYPREVVKAALKHNAGAIIMYHNHPSGSGEPSRADELLTVSLKNALALVDVRVLDHLIICGDAAPATSFAERGLL